MGAVYWMARPPYVRWLVAAAIVGLGILLELSDRATTSHPFLVVDTPAGTPLTTDRIELREVPAGFLQAPALEQVVAAVDLEAGTPLVAAMLHPDTGLPAGWMALPIPVPPGATVGAGVQLVLTSTGETVPGRIVATGADSGFGFEEPGLVAVAPERVAAVAIAASTSDLVVAIASTP